MELEKQVCSLELAKRLKELGVKQESLFVWFKPLEEKWEIGLFDGTFFHGENGKQTGHYGYRFGLSKETPSAFTVAELGEMLPRPFQIYSYPTLVNGKEIWDCTSGDPRIKTTEGWSGDGASREGATMAPRASLTEPPCVSSLRVTIPSRGMAKPGEIWFLGGDAPLVRKGLRKRKARFTRFPALTASPR